MRARRGTAVLTELTERLARTRPGKGRLLGLAAAVLLTGALARPAAAACERLLAAPASPEDPPIAWTWEGSPAGAGPELVKMIAAELGIGVSVATAKRADLLIGVRPQDKRLGVYQPIDPPFLFDAVVAVTRANGRFTYAGRDDLAGRRGVAVEGEGFGPELDRFVAERLDIRRVRGVGMLITMVLSGQADYGIGGYFPIAARAAETGTTDRLAFLSPSLTGSERLLAIRQSSACIELKDRIGREVEARIADGTIQRLVSEAMERWAQERAR